MEVVSGSMHEEAQKLHVDSFYQRIEKIADTNPELASDMRLTITVSEAIRAEGGEALVVGGFIRDELYARITGQPVIPKDIDLEVYGMEFEDLKTLIARYGYVKLTGDHFSVAKLHNPETGHPLDCSIPRRDSKLQGGKHKDFQVEGDPTMSIPDAARRRDFTMNALALNPFTGEVHDYFGGIDDMKRGVLRATDVKLFADDPLRVLRAMQFAGRFEFEIDPATAELCRGVDLSKLPRERVGEEWDKLMEHATRPSVGLEYARDLGVLHKLHPDIAILDTIEQEPDWHPEGNVWEHTKLAVDAAAKIIRDEQLEGQDARIVMYGALCHDLGKATTTAHTPMGDGTTRITAYGHDSAGVEPTIRFLNQVYQSQDTIDKVAAIVKGHMFHTRATEPTDGAIRRFARRLEPANIRLYDLVARSDSNGRGKEWKDSTASRRIYERSLELDVAEQALKRAVEGRDIAKMLQIKPSPLLGRVVQVLYEAQMDSLFTTREEGLAYLQANKETIMTEAERRTEEFLAAQAEKRRQRAEALAKANAERKRQKQEEHQKRMATQKSKDDTPS